MSDPVPAPTEADQMLDLAEGYARMLDACRRIPMLGPLGIATVLGIIRRCAAAEARVRELERQSAAPRP